jgi:4-hydroxybutyryl-CoA dehydratase/vinylacetyl-CoA-Delta-isomerase
MADWTKGEPIRTGDDYVESLRNRNLTLYLMGEKVSEPVDHPVIRPSINALAATYDLAVEDPALASARSSIVDEAVNRFLHVTESAADVVAQNKMQRRLGQLTGTCFQRCVGMDAINSTFSVTHDIDATHGPTPRATGPKPPPSRPTPISMCGSSRDEQMESSSGAPRLTRRARSTHTGSS